MRIYAYDAKSPLENAELVRQQTLARDDLPANARAH